MILTLLICCFLGLGALQPSCAAQRSNENNVVEVKERKEYAGYLQTYYFSDVDLVSQTFISNSITYFKSLEPWSIFGEYRPNDLRAYTISYYFGYNSTLLKFQNYENGQLYDNGYVSRLSITHQPYNLTYEYQDVYTFKWYSNQASYIDANFLSYSVYLYDERDRMPYFTIGALSGDTPWRNQDYCGVKLIESTNDEEHFIYDRLIGSVPDGFTAGYDLGYQNGVLTKQQEQYDAGYSAGLSYGEIHPNEATYNSIYQTGRQAGYSEGLAEAQDQTTLASQIFTGCVEVGLLPVNVFLQMFEYEVFGINIAGFVSALMTIAIVIIIIRMVTGGKNDK